MHGDETTQSAEGDFPPRVSEWSLMSRPDILEAIEQGDILYEGGSPQNINSASIDLTLGPWFWVETALEGERRIFNPNSRDDVNRVWGELWFAPPHWWWIREWNLQSTLRGFDPSTLLFFIPPGRQILCHTREFVGGRSRDVTTTMKARSSAGRSFLEVCRCAGSGDIGYGNRWTMEFTNSSAKHNIPLMVGQRYAQLAFFRTRELSATDADYRREGKYQSGEEPTEIRRHWTPESMRPAMYADREVRRPDEQRFYYRCTNSECGRHGEKPASALPAMCTCGAPVRVYEAPPASERVFPLYDVCVECRHVYDEWHPKSLADGRRFRAAQEEARDYPLRCLHCEEGHRHFLGGEYLVQLPDVSRPLEA